MKKLVRKILIVYCFIFSYVYSKEINFDHLTIKDGLSHSSVFCINQDSNGFLWFGTVDGLNQYDGNGFTSFVFNPLDTNSLSGNYITAMHIDGHDNIWIGTGNGGLNKYNQKCNDFERFTNSSLGNKRISSNNIQCLLEYPKGSLWIGTYYGGLNRLDMIDNTILEIYEVSGSSLSIPSNNISALCRDKKGNVWIGTFDNGIVLFNCKTNTFLPLPSVFKGALNNSVLKNITALVYENDDFIWIGTADYGLIRLNMRNNKTEYFKHNQRDNASISSNCISDILLDSQKRVWIGTDGSGLCKFNANLNNFSRYDHTHRANSLGNNAIESLFEDRDKNIWIGTFGAGLNKIDYAKKKFSSYKKVSQDKNSLSNNNVLSFTETKDGILWIGTDGGGLNRFDIGQKSFKHYLPQKPNKNAISDNVVMTLYTDNKGFIWIGTFKGGLNKFDTKNESFYTFKSENSALSSNFVTNILSDQNDMLWIGTYGGGLNYFDPIKEQFLPIPFKTDSLSKDITTLFEDSQGYIWIGTYAEGLFVFNPKDSSLSHHIYNASLPSTLSYNTIYSIYEDTKGNIWIGTGSGLNKYIDSTQSFMHYSQMHGLPDNMIYGIVEDSRQNLWLSTNNGIAQFNPKTESCKNYYVESGIQSNGFSSGAYFKAANGHILFGGVQGFTHFNPDSIQEDSIVFRPVITEFRIFNKPITSKTIINGKRILDKAILYTDTVKLSFRENVISFSFSAMNVSSVNNTYAYIMDGFDKEWVYTKNRRFVSYTELPAGSYTFKIKCANSDGVWSSSLRKLTVIISPPFWKTLWFRIVGVTLVLILLYSYYKLKTRNIKKQKEKLEKQVKDRTEELVQKTNELEVLNEQKNFILGMAAHDIKNPLSIIHGFSTLLQKGRYPAQRLGFYINKIVNNCNRMNRMLVELLDISAIESGKIALHKEPIKIQEILNDAVELYTDMAEQKGIVITYEKSNGLPFINADKIRMSEVFDNLISNAIKYTPEKGFITIWCEEKDDNVVIHVKDTGQGFDPDELSKVFQAFAKIRSQPTGGEVKSGLGLAITKKVVDMHDGTISVNSTSGNGAIFKIVLPIC